MTCQLPPPLWWQDYLAGRLTTPQQIYAASLAEHKAQATPEAAFFDDPLDPGPQWKAPESLKAPDHFKRDSWLRQCQRADWAHADNRLAVWSAIFVHMALKRDIPLYVHTALRDQNAQTAVLKAGNSKVAYPNSAHNIGEAVDIVHGVLHWQMNEQEWQLLGVLGRLALDRLNASLRKDRKLHLTWGGDWKFYDPAHWEITDYRARTAIKPRVTPVHRTPYGILKQRNHLLDGAAIGDPVPLLT